MINKGSPALWISVYFLMNTYNYNVYKHVDKVSIHLWMSVDE